MAPNMASSYPKKYASPQVSLVFKPAYDFVQFQIYNFSHIMLIWCGLSTVSLIIGLFLFPNQNLDQKSPKLTQDDSFVAAVKRREVIGKNETLKSRLQQRKSPQYYFYNVIIYNN